MTCHCLNQEAPVEEQIPHLAARFRNEQAPVAGSTVGCPVSTAAIRLMVGTNRVIRADHQPIERTSQNAGES